MVWCAVCSADIVLGDVGDDEGEGEDGGGGGRKGGCVTQTSVPLQNARPSRSPPPTAQPLTQRRASRVKGKKIFEVTENTQIRIVSCMVLSMVLNIT